MKLAFVAIVCIVTLPSTTIAQADTSQDEATTAVDESNAETIPQSDTSEAKPGKPREKKRKSYLGRVLAQPMSHLGAPWLVRRERDEEENTSESFKELRLEPGMDVCDLGCGNGYWTLPMARDVGPEGTVYAVDIQREMLQKLDLRASKFDLQNIRPTLGKIDDPRLPENAIDLLLMVDVYHEFSHPQSMLWEIRRSLKPKGVVALLEYREEDPNVPIKPLHKMSKQQIMKEYQANGLKLVREYNGLPWQHLMFFARDDSPLEAIDPKPTDEVLESLHK
ncbi:class I SAM-dependent methyltransferase [Stieleria sp. JC731]|uniref:class I SAM-dependent methyltransferase n=1 Tax=Pirellulaceae TaxID=2691357 RepID=UPI001E5C6CBF|nr:class I SAM-dependent methyltransferase [Stieleria sp. JC731]MCC9601848.1 class I SAM-dependent methyltransferase [Stieleria sp. JC731]